MLKIAKRFFCSGAHAPSKFSSIDHIKKLTVIGSGQMGTGIAIIAAKVGQIENVHLIDPNEEAQKRSRAFMEKWLDKEIKKERCTEKEKYAVLLRVTCGNTLETAHDSDFVIEAVNEDFELKKKIFECMDRITDKETILATNTSSISITKIAATTKRPEKVIGMHYFNPVPVMRNVELIKALQTSEHTLEQTSALSLKLGKEFVLCKDVPGFVANRILMPWINEAVFCLYEGIATAEDIDKDIKLGTNVPMGPLTLADFIGLDTCLAVMNVMHEGLGDPKFRPCPLLRQYVDAGWLGRKSGRGFYKYD